jgi:hypothetical protein
MIELLVQIVHHATIAARRQLYLCMFFGDMQVRTNDMQCEALVSFLQLTR